MKVLVVEDDVEVAGFIVQCLREAGHEAVLAATGEAALERAAEGFEAVVLDRMLPGGLDGVQVLRALRDRGDGTPVLFLSALAGLDDRVGGLRAGADDYLTKPFASAELLARVEALGRRGRLDAQPDTRLVVGDLELDLLARVVHRGGARIELQPREFRLLKYLMRHAGQVVTRTMLLEGVWDYHFDPQTNVVDVHISRLRQKIDKPFAAPLIQTVRNAGYTLKAE